MKRRLVISSIAFFLLVAMVLGIIYNENIILSKADNVSMDETIEEDIEVLEGNDFSIDSGKNSQELIRDIKDKYRYTETIADISLLKSELKRASDISEKEVEKVIASTKDNVLNEFILNEQKETIYRMSESMNQLQNVVNNDEDIPSEINYVAYENGDYEIEKTSVDETGTVSKAKIIDREISNTKGWHKKKTISGKVEKIKYGERSSYFVYQERIAIVCTLTIGFTLNYKASSNGLKATKITDSGTKTNYIGSTLEFQNGKKNLADTVATHEGANVDGSVEAKFKVFPGIKIGDVQFPSGVSYSFKINFWLTLSKWNKTAKSMEVKQGMTIYVDDIGILSQ